MFDVVYWPNPANKQKRPARTSAAEPKLHCPAGTNHLSSVWKSVSFACKQKLNI